MNDLSIHTRSIKGVAAPRMTAVLSALLTVLAAACQEDETETGSLGNGAFVYNCIDETDPQCPPSPDDTGTPFPILALGGTFNLTYNASNDGYATATVVPVSTAYFLQEGNDFTAIRSGTPSFYAETPNDLVLDFTQVTVEPIRGIQINDTTASSFSEPSDPTHQFTGVALGGEDEVLGGRVLYFWTSSDPAVLAIVPGQPSPSSAVTVTFGRKGTATLTAKNGDATGSTDILVSGGE